jgi:thymidylate synthase
MEHFMANRLDEQYQSLLQDIIDFGADKQDRTGTGFL